MVRDDSGHLDLRVRAELPALEEEVLCRLQEAMLCVWARDGVQLSVARQPVARIVRVENGTEERREVDFLPELGRCLVPLAPRIDDVGINRAWNPDLDADINS